MANDWLQYANAGATRNMPVNPQLAKALGFLPELGLSMEVFSGGQPAKGTSNRRVGSTRHDHGNSADVFFRNKEGRRIDWANPADRPVFEEIVSRAKANGVTGFGAGPGYMQPGSMHIGFGAPSVWGAGGSSKNAPDWLRNAYNSAPGSASTAAPALQNPYTDMADGPKGQEVYQPAPSQDDTGGGLFGSGLFAGNDAGPVPEGAVGLASDKPESPLGGFFEALAKTPDAPAPRMGPMPDARGVGTPLLDIMKNPKYSQLLLGRRMGA